MHLSEGTVKQYVSQVLDILDVNSRVHAAVAAYRSGLL
jgi:DNA-binding NarL/FixJ family response regulator